MRIDPTPLVERLRALARSQDRKTVREELADTHVADLAEGFVRLDAEEGMDLLRHLPADTAADLLIELPDETARQYLDSLPDTTLAHYLDILPMDDALDLRDTIGEERFDALLNVIPAEDAQEIRRLLAYPEDAVGRLMTEAFFTVSPQQTMQELLDDIRRSPVEKYEMVNDIYVVDEDRHLLGVFGLRKAIRSRPDSTAREVMNDEVFSCSAHDTAEHAARQMARYGFYGLPVLDDRGRMVGLLTGDDAQAIIREADTEDVLKLGAVSGTADAYISLSVWQLYKRRVFWLLGLFMAETLTGSVMRYYTNESAEATTKLAQLVVYLPLMIGAGGNSGSQTTTTITRALALGEVKNTDAWVVLSREALTAAMLGITVGIVGYLRAIVWRSPMDVCFVVGLALPMIVLWASTVGSVLPLAARRFGIDPAVMSAPFISTLVDATGLVFFFEIARRVVGGI